MDEYEIIEEENKNYWMSRVNQKKFGFFGIALKSNVIVGFEEDFEK